MTPRMSIMICALVGAVAASAQDSAEDSSYALTQAIKVTDSDRAKAGMLGEHPYLGNRSVVFLWATPQEGCGLMSIYDKAGGKELLKVDADEAAMWRIEMKESEKEEKVAHESAGRACEVACREEDGEGIVSFTWAGDVEVEVKVRLRKDESLARSRIRVKAGAGPGLKTVVFPKVKGVAPMTEGAAPDEVLMPTKLGWTQPSPLTSGKALNKRYPIEVALQMTALLGEGGGLYFGEEDPDACEKTLSWEADAGGKTLSFSMSHNVLDWGADDPVREYELPGDSVMGPFQGDWFDAGRVYRKWALTAPWCAKGPIYEREDTPKWFTRVPYWSVGGLGQEDSIEREMVKQDFLGVPGTICHDYWYSMNRYQHDRNPEYFPPKPGSENYKRIVREMHDRGVRVLPYVIGWLWNMTTESYREEDAERKGTMFGPKGGKYWTWAGGLDPQAAMCPATEIWRNKMVDVAKELVGVYGHDGVYFDYFTCHCNDCFVKEHGHPIAGGNYWTKSVHGLYERVRAEIKKLNSDSMLCGEDLGEWCIDVLDASYTGGPYSNAPVFMVAYHGYYQAFGGIHNKNRPEFIGRWWLMGCINGPTNQMQVFARPTNDIYRQVGPWYRDLIRCSYEFAYPYLGYGEMLRPPRIEGELPTITAQGDYGPFTLPAVQGSAWRAPDGSVGIFILNYDMEKPHAFTWRQNLNEIVGIGSDKRVKVTQWTPDEGEKPGGEWSGGVLERKAELEPLGLIALKLEVVE